MNFIDLFSGEGGLSEGFINAGFNPIAHVEIDAHACNTLETILVYHKVKYENNLHSYN
jgi:DNA (cytosine-5)-methyltransferase 1